MSPSCKKTFLLLLCFLEVTSWLLWGADFCSKIRRRKACAHCVQPTMPSPDHSDALQISFTFKWAHIYRLPQTENSFTICSCRCMHFDVAPHLWPPPSIQQISSAYYMFPVTPHHSDSIFSVHHSLCLTSSRRVPSDPRLAFFVNNLVIDTILRHHISHFALKSCWNVCFFNPRLKACEGHRFLKARQFCIHGLSYWTTSSPLKILVNYSIFTTWNMNILFYSRLTRYFLPTLHPSMPCFFSDCPIPQFHLTSTPNNQLFKCFVNFILVS